jgi:hypothetical protein
VNLADTALETVKKGARAKALRQTGNASLSMHALFASHVTLRFDSVDDSKNSMVDLQQPTPEISGLIKNTGRYHTCTEQNHRYMNRIFANTPYEVTCTPVLYLVQYNVLRLQSSVTVKLQ